MPPNFASCVSYTNTPWFVSLACFLGATGTLGGDEGNPNNPNGRLLCNSIGCPNGFIPIDDAQNTECDADPCEASQCCQAFCSFHPCPNGFIPIADAGTTICPDRGCNDDLCCVDGEYTYSVLGNNTW